MFKPKAQTANWEPIAGVGPWRDLSDDEAAAVDPAVLERWFDHVPDAGDSSRNDRATDATGDTAGAGGKG